MFLYRLVYSSNTFKIISTSFENELKNPAIVKVIEKDNAEILQERKEIEREEKEMWTGFVEGLENRDM